MLRRKGGTVGFYAGNNAVGHINLNVSAYDVKWYRNAYSDQISIFADRDVWFLDDYVFEFDWGNLNTVATDVIPSIIAGPGKAYKIHGSWIDKIDHQYTSWKCRFKKISS